MDYCTGVSLPRNTEMWRFPLHSPSINGKPSVGLLWRCLACLRSQAHLRTKGIDSVGNDNS